MAKRPHDFYPAEVPVTGWKPPKDFPDLSGAKAIAVDTETRDKGISAGLGPGWAWEGGGYVVGISVAVPEGQSWYFPFRHKHTHNVQQFNPAQVLKWAQDQLGRAEQPKIGANLAYDIGWLKREGVTVRGKCYDVQTAEPLLDAYRPSYSLGTLSELYGVTESGKGDPESMLYQWLSDSCGGPATRKGQGGNIWLAPAELVGPYAEFDATAPFKIIRKQLRLLKKQDLLEIFDIESRLIPLLVEMRYKGIHLNKEQALETREKFSNRVVSLKEELCAKAGTREFVDGRDWLEKVFAAHSIPHGFTPKGNKSFAADVLKQSSHEIPKLILKIRKMDKTISTFIDGPMKFLDKKGFIHPEFIPLPTGDNGSGPGRFASARPNFQNMPSRDEELKLAIRGMFDTVDPDTEWTVEDYSQVEYRFFVHCARGEGAEAARQNYRDNPDTDYHDLAHDLIYDMVRMDLDRKPVKNINFGTIFGMGVPKLKTMLGVSDAEAEAILDAYFTGLPFVKTTAKTASRIATNRGYIKTVLGRRVRFDRWESCDYELSKKHGAFSENEARVKYSPGSQHPTGIRRAWTYKALNNYTQGSGGDTIKKALVDVYEQLNEIPEETVHDEIGLILPKGAEGARRRTAIREVMENAVKISVPLLCDVEVGPTWGTVKEVGA